MNEYITGSIDALCYMVQCGKPCASEAIHERDIEDVVKSVEISHQLKTLVEDLAPGWKTLYVYRDEFMLEIIKSLPETPKTVFDHWVLGKAYGYSDEAIKRFLDATFSERKNKGGPTWESKN